VNELQDWVGRETTSAARIEAHVANQMAVTLDRDPGFRDGDLLPPGWHWLYFHDLVPSSDMGIDGHPRLGLILPPVPLQGRMWAGGELHFEAPVVIGSELTRVSTIRSIETKTGRSGPLCFVTVEHRIRAGGEPAITEQQSIVYRDAAAPRSPSASPPGPDQADWSRRWSFDPITLFRYSALTFNGHRIHYDPDWARRVEGYPGLVVQGPLIATLLLDLAAQVGRPLGHFTYRARSPVFLPQDFTVNATAVGDDTNLWVTTSDGRLAMDGRASPT
jgi:3-methylfumaryl-CoA hydratase